MSLLLLINKNIYQKGGGEKSFHFMIKNSSIPVIEETKNEEENPGSAEYQIYNFTYRVLTLTFHLKLHPKDYLSQRGLRKILGKRQRILFYFKKKNYIRYKQLIRELGLRDSKIR